MALPTVDITSYSYDIHIFDLSFDVPSFPASSSKSSGFESATTSADVQTPRPNSTAGRAILHDNLLSHRKTGIRRCIFQCDDGSLQDLCRLHGLKNTDTSSTRTRWSKLLYHLFNGDCIVW